MSHTSAMINPQIIERLSLYLHALGVDAPDAFKLSENILKQCIADHPHDPHKQLDVAIAKVQQCRDTWLNAASPELYPDALPQTGEAQLGMQVWHLRRVLSQTHGNILNDMPSKEQCQAILEGCWPVVPTNRPVEMPRQSFGNLPGPLRMAMWKRIWRSMRNKVSSSKDRQNESEISS